MTRRTANLTAALFTVGQRVEMLPHTDWFMRGARYGTVLGVWRGRVSVQLDAGKVIHVAGTSIKAVQ
jgi:hypothetical protein